MQQLPMKIYRTEQCNADCQHAFMEQKRKGLLYWMRKDQHWPHGINTVTNAVQSLVLPTFRGMEYCISLIFSLVIPYLSNVPPSCRFYLFLTKLVILLLAFIIFLKVSTWYKLRQREIIVNVHAIAENHWEKYMDQREEYEILQGTHDDISCSYGSTDTTNTR